MGIGVSIFLITVGAILTFAIEATAEGIDINSVGVILMVVGALGLLASMIFWSNWSPAGRDRTVVVQEDPVVMQEAAPTVVREVRPRRTVVREDY